MEGDVANAVRANALLAAIAQELGDGLARSRVVDCPPGHVLARQDAPADRMFLVVSGQVELLVGQAGGDDGVIDVLGAGESFGEESLFDAGCYEVGARAVDSARLLEIDGADLLRLLDRRFDIVLAMLAGMSSRLRRLIHDVAELKLKSTTQRLAGFLLAQADPEIPSQAVRLPFDKRLLADKLGMKPESLSRAFSRLRRIDVRTIGHDRVFIGDIAGLRRFCRHGESS